MHYKQLKMGMKVKISKDISTTDRHLTSNTTMHNMAGDGKTYTIREIRPSNGKRIAKIGRYIWMPEDLIDVEEGYKPPVSMKGKKVTFDPCEL